MLKEIDKLNEVLWKILKYHLKPCIDEELAELRKEKALCLEKANRLLNKNSELEHENLKLKKEKYILLDLVAKNQKRIDALLRQISEK